MTRYAIVTDLNRCVGCLACSVACKTTNNVPVGSFWNKTLRIGPNPQEGGSGDWPDVEMYFLTMQCQHCGNPECVKVCPTSASHVAGDGTVQIDKAKCIGCQFCAMACPYGVRYLNEEERVVEKCTLCEQKIAQGELPSCVAQCGGRARFFGDLGKGIDSMEAPWVGDITQDDVSYQGLKGKRITLKECVTPYTEADFHTLPNLGNDPSFLYLLRNRKWQGEK
ncbi:4Fe-4S dicluster domain-containing protein [Parvibacter caecicola]|uniref:4Fe-4S dicluster domain-containing protein n=1 Tax=Parvibacter caecicola TaxID=747645 RepID=UPI00272F835E|nr:4Fe-4S dicluster domain-containing protein [Parvibacter caecicola]